MRRGLLLGFLGAVLLLVAWWFFFISPRNANIDEARSDLVAAQGEESRLRAQIAQLQDILDSEVEYLAAIGTLDALIPERPMLEEFIEQVNDLAGATGVDLETLAPSLPIAVDETALREISITINIEGQFFDVLGFLYGLEDLERLTKVDQVSLSSVLTEDGSTVLQVTLQVNLYTLADLVPVTIEQPDPPDVGPPDDLGGDTGGDTGGDVEAGGA